MKKAKADPGTIELSVPRPMYARESIEIAAHIFERRAQVYLEETPKTFKITLQARRPGRDAAWLESQAGEFINELLNQEYRAIVGRFNGKLSNLIVTQALFSARGGEHPPAPLKEDTPEMKAKIKAMMDEASAEIERTMPRKVAPQGIPLTLSGE